MHIIAEFSLPMDSLPFSAAVADSPISRIEFEPILPTERLTLPFFRVWSGDDEGGVEPLCEDPAVDSVTLGPTVGDARLCRVEWRDGEIAWLREVVEETGVALLGATVDADGWHLRMRAAEEADLLAFQQRCREAGVAPDLSRVTTADRAAGNGSEAVTPAQREALLLAIDRGYFDRPREVTLEELAADLDISRQAFAGRLRRGQRNLIRNTFENA